MKKLFALLLMLALTMSAAAAEPLPLGDTLSGTACWPEEADEASARYVYRYAYPTIDSTDDVGEMINGFYEYLVDDALAFVVPMAAELLDEDGPQAYTNITSEITCNNDDWFSVKVVTESFMGAATSTVIAGHSFAREGGKAGTVASLPYLLGLLEAGETDEWLLDRQTAKADALVRRLVWEIIQEQQADGSVAYYDDLTFDVLEANFYPEEDFYLDEHGDPVFFLQEALVAPAADGILLYPFTLEELLDEM